MNQKIEKLADKWVKLSSELRRYCEEYLHNLLHNNPEINWENINLPEFVAVTYDGGNHPEYASNVFSTVYGIKLIDGCIFLNTEDCSQYGLESVTTENLYDLCRFLECYKEEIGI